MPIAVSALKLAFILSRGVPELLQKVSMLLCVIYTLSPTRDQFSLLSSPNGVSECQWASFFHQMTIGSNYSYKLLSRDYKKKNESAMDVDVSCGGGSSSSSMRFRRLAPESVTDLERFVLDFFQHLPRATVICMTVFKDALLGDLLTGSQTKESAWIMFSRLSSDCAPLIIVRPIEPIQEDPSSSALGISDGTYIIPWGHNIIDEIAPPFREFIKERNKDIKLRIYPKLDPLLRGLQRNMENKWFGPWKHLLLGESLDRDQLDFALNKVIRELKSKYDFDAHEKTLQSVMRCAIHAAKDEDKECLLELILKKGCYIGESSNHTSLPEDAIKKLLLDAIIQNGSKTPKRRKIDGEGVKRKPVILVLDYDIQMLPWETMPILRNHEVYRMPSVASIHHTLDRWSQTQRENPTSFPMIDPLDAYCLVNLKGDLDSASKIFGKWFKSLKLDGIYGTEPIDWQRLAKDQRLEIGNRLVNHDLFIYVGHNHGLQYIPGSEIEKHDAYPAAILAGCESAALKLNGPYIPTGAPLHYLVAGSPFVVGNLWKLYGPAVKSLYQTLLKEWINERSEICAECNQVSCEHKPMIGSFMRQARNATKRCVNEGTIVCYGVPTRITRKGM